MLRFASERVSDDWRGDRLDLNLRSVVNQMATFLYRSFAADIVLTCALRTAEEDKALYHDPNHEPGVHVFGRGMDVSVRNLSSGEIWRAVNTINDTWSYDSTRPDMKCAIYETTETLSTAPHIHLQTHPNTKPIEVVAEGTAGPS